jgi:uncharacterized membrane protein
MKPRTHYVLALLLVAAVSGVTLCVAPRLPDTIPTHWNIHGEIDGYGHKPIALLLMPVTMAGLLALFRLLPWLSPMRFEVDAFRPTYLYVMLLVLALLAYLQALMIWAAWSGTADVSRYLVGGLFLFFALVGNVLGRVKRNFWIGIRTPWTLASERVWIDTHRFAARMFVGVGLLGFAAVVAGLPEAYAFGLFLASVLASALYSLVLYKRLERRGEV